MPPMSGSFLLRGETVSFFFAPRLIAATEVADINKRITVESFIFLWECHGEYNS
jgi:hypothetical protein